MQWVMDNRPCKRYDVDGEPLFYRAFLFRAFGRVFYLHHYLRSDPDSRGLHDHPARNLALILAGGYTEVRGTAFSAQGFVPRTVKFLPGSFNFIDQHTFHTLVIPEGQTSWSLFICKYVGGPWGFMRTEGAMDFRTCAYVYTEAGHGIDSEQPWWEAAPSGKELHHAPDGGAEDYDPQHDPQRVDPATVREAAAPGREVGRGQDQEVPERQGGPTEPHGWRGPGHAPARGASGQ